ncbi:hypothetical protein L1049_026776 [Liquidambar formosana]|uniref:Uncharacterized protein n=1 Tax=Liquidambar formosana TaxID=63359 RepID=A0AAP0R927_LIQFO
MPPGRNSSKIEGYRRMKSMGRMGMLRVSLFSAIIEMGMDLEGSDFMRFLMLIMGFRLLSFSTAWSRPRSRTHLEWLRRRRFGGFGGGFVIGGEILIET